MRRQIIATKCLAAVCLAALGLMATSSGIVAQQKASRGKETAVYTTIKDLMDAIVDPSADVVWGAVGTVVDQDGAH